MTQPCVTAVDTFPSGQTVADFLIDMNERDLETDLHTCDDCGSIRGMHAPLCELYGSGPWQDEYVDPDEGTVVDVYTQVAMLLIGR